MIAVKESLLIEERSRPMLAFRSAAPPRLLGELENMCTIVVDVGNFNVPSKAETGRGALLLWMRLFPLDNFYAHPVEGIHPIVDVAPWKAGSHDIFEGRRRLHSGPANTAEYDAEVFAHFPAAFVAA